MTVAEIVKCSECGESVTWKRETHEWLHDRTTLVGCCPRCTTDGCTERATVKLGFHGFDGAGSRFIRTGWACEAHTPAVAGEWT